MSGESGRGGRNKLKEGCTCIYGWKDLPVGIGFDLVYNELTLESVKNVEYLFLFFH